MKALASAALAAMVVLVAYGVLLIDLAFPESITRNWAPILAATESEAAILAALALLAMVMSWAYPRVRGDSGVWAGGMRLGVLTALLAEVYPALFALHFIEVPLAGMVWQVAVFGARDVVAGITVAAVHERLDTGRTSGGG